MNANRTSRRWSTGLAVACLAALPLPQILAQGRTEYMNVESPQVSPLAVANVAGKTLLLVCNTPDNSLEVWDTDESITPATARFRQRVPVGLEPVSVLVQGDRFWTANFLGDSVTGGILDLDPSNNLRARVTATTNLPAPAGFQRGDEPVDLAYVDTGTAASPGPFRLVVTMFSGSSVAVLDPITLAPIGGATTAMAPTSPLLKPHAVKEPRAVRAFGNQVVVLATKGGFTDPQSFHDLDLLRGTVSAGGVSFATATGGLGTTNYNLRVAGNGDLFVVGAEAHHFVPNDKPALRTLPTGFVSTMLYRVSTAGAVTRRDANLGSTGAVIPKAGSSEGKPTALLTDLAILESGGAVQKVYGAAMGNDRIAVFSPIGASNAADVATWIRSTIDLPTGTLNGAKRFGPRGLVLAQIATGSRLYVLNRIDNSIVTIDTATDTVLANESYALAADPTPDVVKLGRRFLYDAELSGKGFVACASCHTDGRTDALAWRLGNPQHILQPNVPKDLPPSADFIISVMGTGTFDVPGVLTSDPDYELQMLAQRTFDPNVPDGGDPNDDKREMVTQSLQGLLNFEIAPNALDLTTNAPYHWRGDKPSVRDFNEAFVTLLEAVNIGTNLTGPQALDDQQMDDFEEFVNSITYPPNPKQPIDRVYAAGTAGREGLELFHTAHTVLAGRSCAACHSLPEGSNNRATVFAGESVIPGFVTITNRQPIESAALRGLFQKEPLLEADGASASNLAPITGHYGMNHTGLQPVTGLIPGTNTVAQLTGINSFIDLFGVFNAIPAAQLQKIKQFVHELDWGVAPMVGEVVHIPQAILGTAAGNAAVLRAQRMVAQANAGNASVVVWLQRPNAPTGRLRGFRWAPSFQLWFEEPTFVAFTDASLLALPTAPEDSLTLLSVPLGSERRIATTAGGVVPVPIPVPPTATMVGFATNTAYVDVPTFEKNYVSGLWWPGVPPGNTLPSTLPEQIDYFNHTPLHNVAPRHFVNGTAIKDVDDVFAKTLRIFQFALFDRPSPAPSYGVHSLHHEAPRRIRIAGTNILTGARLQLGIPQVPNGYAGTSPLQWSQGTGTPLLRIVELPIHPRIVNGQTVWETAVEVDPMVAHMLMLGGPTAPGVAATITDVIMSEHTGSTPLVAEPLAAPWAPLPFAPDTWNWYRIQVVNPDVAASTSPATWGQLKLL